MAKKKCDLPIVDDITKYVLQMVKDDKTRRMTPVKNTYADKNSGEIVFIDWRDGAFRLLEKL